MSKTQELLALVDQFDTRRRIEFDDEGDRSFIIEVFKALKAAAPEIRAAAFEVTIQPTPSAESTGSPSNAEPITPAVESNTHNQASSQNTAGTAEATGQTADTSGKSASASAKPSGPAKTKRARRSKKQRLNDPLKVIVAPPAEPQSTDDTSKASSQT